MYINLSQSVRDLARSVAHLLLHCHWHSFTLLSDDSPAILEARGVWAKEFASPTLLHNSNNHNNNNKYHDNHRDNYNESNTRTTTSSSSSSPSSYSSSAYSSYSDYEESLLLDSSVETESEYYDGSSSNNQREEGEMDYKNVNEGDSLSSSSSYSSSSRDRHAFSNHHHEQQRRQSSRQQQKKHSLLKPNWVTIQTRSPNSPFRALSELTKATQGVIVLLLSQR
jgi:hypothetical protein